MRKRDMNIGIDPAIIMHRAESQRHGYERIRSGLWAHIADEKKILKRS
jgi:hypothetical protein